MGRQLLVTVVGSILGVGIAVLSTPFIPLFDESLNRWKYVVPTCGDPRGLELLDIAAMQADGDATVEVSSDETTGKTWGMMLAFDGRPGSGWVPATKDDDTATDSAEASKDWMVLNFKNPQRVALVCVVNGKANDWNSYLRADRARTVEVSLDDGRQEAKRKTSLRTLPQHELQNRQELEMPDPKAPAYNRVSLTLLDRYVGSPVDDPNTTEAIDAPTGLVMLAEVEVWVEAGKK